MMSSLRGWRAMPSIYELKPRFQQLLQPVLSRLHLWGVSANQLTWLAIGLSVLGGVCTLLAVDHHGWLLAIPVVLFLRMALNALDGMMARQFHQSTRFGGVLNEVGDVASDLALYMPWLVLVPQHWLSLLAVGAFGVLALLNEFCGVLAQALAGQRRYDGPMGKSDRAFLVGLLALVLFCFPAALRIVPWMFGAGCLLELLSCFHRLSFILQLSTDND